MSKLTTKWILDNAVNDLKIRLRNNQPLRARNAADNADVNVLKVNASDKIEFLSVPQVTADASANNDLVRLSQLNTALALKVDDTEKGAANGVATLDANGLVPITQMPPAAIERLVVVADQAARFALTTATVQNGDTVKQTDTGLMYFVKDDANLDSAAGYEVYIAGSAATVPWSGVSGTPTTISGYGITDFNSTFDTQLATKDTDDIAEGATNLYYTSARFDSAFGTKTTTDLAEGTNLYYTQARFDSAFGAKSTSDLSEGTNLYFTDERAQDAVGAMVASSSKVSLTYVDGTPSLTADIVAASLVDADIAVAAAIAESKLALDYSTSGLNTAITNHVGDTANPHSVTKTQVGLGNVDDVQQLPMSYLDTDNTLAANSDAKVASQKAVKAYIASQLATMHVPAAEILTISAQNITDGWVDLADEAFSNASVVVTPVGGVMQEQGQDYTLSVVSTKTRITFAGDLLGLEAGDKLMVQYSL